MIIKKTIHIFFPLMFLLFLLMDGCITMDGIKEKLIVSKKSNSTSKDEVLHNSSPSNMSEANQKDIHTHKSETDQKDIRTHKSEVFQKIPVHDKGEAIYKNSNEETLVIETLKDKKDVSIKKERQLPVYGYVEYVHLGPDRLKLKAKLDSGAKTSSLNALDIVEFERDGNQWVRFNMIDPSVESKVELEKKIEHHIKIKQHDTESERRPVIMMDVQLGTIHIEREFTLAGRNNFIYQVLLGRNFLNGVALIDVSRTFVASDGSE